MIKSIEENISGFVIFLKKEKYNSQFYVVLEPTGTSLVPLCVCSSCAVWNFVSSDGGILNEVFVFWTILKYTARQVWKSRRLIVSPP